MGQSTPQSTAHVKNLSQKLALAVSHVQSGQIAAAEEILRKTLRNAPNDVAALNLLSIVEYKSGRPDAAVAAAERALELSPGAPSAHANLAVMYRKLGNTAKAIEHGRLAVELKPDFADAHYNLGLALFDARDCDAAIAHYDKAIALNPRLAEAFNNRGVVLHWLQRFADAAAEYRRALSLRPSYPEALNNLGSALRDQGKDEDAVLAYKKAVEQRPLYLDALRNLIKAHGRLRQFGDAIAAGRAALRANPNDKTTLESLAAVYLEARMPDEAIAMIKALMATGETNAAAYEALGRAYFRTADVESAVSAYREAIARQPDSGMTYALLGNALSELGRFDEAQAAFDAALKHDPKNADTHLGVASMHTFRSSDDPRLQVMESLDHAELPPERRLPLHFALGKAYDDLGRFDEAFAQFAAGNALRRLTMASADADNIVIERSIALMDAGMIGARSGHGAASDRPIFVLGMPRSGTTLVEQILASHPSVGTIGETNDLSATIGAATRRAGSGATYPQFLDRLPPAEFAAMGEDYLKAMRRRQPTARRVVDKAPENFFFVGLIHLILPNARIVHVTRDPLDTCLSCFSKHFEGWNQTSDLAELGRFYRLYEKMMLHWRAALPPGAFLDVSYEALVADPDASTKRILDHCDLEWDDAVRNFYTHKRAIKTASLVQARQPIYHSSIGRWRNYRKHLTPLMAELFATSG